MKDPVDQVYPQFVNTFAASHAPHVVCEIATEIGRGMITISRQEWDLQPNTDAQRELVASRIRNLTLQLEKPPAEPAAPVEPVACGDDEGVVNACIESQERKS